MRELLDRVQAAVSDDGRLSPGAMASSGVFPFEREGLRVRPLEEFVDPEPDRRKALLDDLDDAGHVELLARPEGVLQLRGSNLADWADMLPPTLAEELDTRATLVRDTLAHAG